MNKAWRVILSYWRGNEELWKAFWIVWVGSYFVTFICGKGIESIVNANLSKDFGARIAAGMIVFPSIAILVALTIWSCVSFWRCAPNTSSQLWCWVARGLIILNIISWVSSWFR